MPINTTETMATDAVLELSRSIAQQKVRLFDYQDIPENNRDLYCQASILIDAAHAVVRAIAENSWDSATLPHGRINQLSSDVILLATEIPNILASRL